MRGHVLKSSISATPWLTFKISSGESESDCTVTLKWNAAGRSKAMTAIVRREAFSWEATTIRVKLVSIRYGPLQCTYLNQSLVLKIEYLQRWNTSLGRGLSKQMRFDCRREMDCTHANCLTWSRLKTTVQSVVYIVLVRLSAESNQAVSGRSRLRNSQQRLVPLHYPSIHRYSISAEWTLGKRKRHTRVAFINPARVWPTRMDSSSVANASSCRCNVLDACAMNLNHIARTFANGMMAKNETDRTFSRVRGWKIEKRTDEDEGIAIWSDEMQNPLYLG